MVLGMLVYSSCESNKGENAEESNSQPEIENDEIKSGFAELSELIEKHNELNHQRNDFLDNNLNETDANKIRQLNIELVDVQQLMQEKLSLLNDEANRLPLERRLSIISEEIANKDSLTTLEKQEMMKTAEALVNKINASAKPVNGWTVTTGINNPNVDSYPFATIEEVPVFPGCENAADKKECFMENLENHIKKNFHYPEAAQEKGIQGRVATVFVIDVDGSITDVRTRGPHPILEEEAKRILEKLPKMLPGKQKGQVMKVPYSIPITFRLQTQPAGTTVNGFKDYLLVSGKRVKKDGKTIFEGTVMDKESMPLSGVIVSIEGKDTGVMSNFNGIFSLAVDEADVVKFQYSGLPNKVVKVSDY
ncbi:energy transducer TonB [Flagellimonas sediminis]|uniref:energy transducer TonB n=1 Tax=Flagellimonas sediminis TaxID=2696468 RepID=UPI001F29468A|nr:TonB family protein [Allomuricauda sediminis]